MKQGIANILLVLASGMLFFGTACADRQPLRIGAILALSGSVSSVGGYLQRSLQLAHESLPEAERQSVQIIFEDDAFQPARSIAAFHKLLGQDKVDLVMALGSSAGNALAPLAENAGVPLVVLGASDKNVVLGRRWSFLHWLTPETDSQVMLDEIIRRGYQSVGIISTEQEGVIAAYNAIVSDFEKRALKSRLVLDERYLMGTSDFKLYAAKARSRKLDAIIICMLPGEIAAFARQIRQAGVRADLVGVELFEDENEVRASQGALLDQWYVNADSGTPEFEKAYRARFNEQPGFATANAYDAFNIAISAWRKTGTDRTAMRDLFFGLRDYQGAAGRYSATGDNRFTLPAAIKVVRKSGFEKLR